MELLRSVRYAILLWTGQWLAARRLNALRQVTVNGQTFLLKRRKWMIAYYIAAGNLYLRVARAGVQVLSLQDWRTREVATYQALYGVQIDATASNGILLPIWTGRSLAHVLVDSSLDVSVRLECVRLAARELAALHRLCLPDGAGLFSHGDAIAANVMISPEHDRARWIDFDTAHTSGLTMQWRHADDFRALLGSCAVRIKVVDWPRLITAACEGYGNQEIVAECAPQLVRDCLRPSLFHLAQAAMTYEKLKRLSELMTAACTSANR